MANNSIIDFRKETQNTFDKINKYTEARNYIHNSQICLTNKAMMDFYYQQGKKVKDEAPKAYMFYWHGIAAIQYACVINDLITANLLVKSMLEAYDSSLTISSYNKSLLLKMLYSTNEKEKVENFNELENVIIKMNLE